MDDKSITDLLSQLIPDEQGKDSAEKEQPKDQDNILVEGLKTLVGQSEGDLEQAVSEFLKGKGVLHEITNSAVTRGKATADSEIAEILTKTFKLSPTIARLIAPLLTNLLPSVKKEQEKEAPSAKKPRRKTKPKTSSKEKEQTTSKKKPSKKTASEAKTSAEDKETASAKKPKKKTATKPKTSSEKPKKKTTPSSKPKKIK